MFQVYAHYSTNENCRIQMELWFLFSKFLGTVDQGNYPGHFVVF